MSKYNSEKNKNIIIGASDLMREMDIEQVVSASTPSELCGKDLFSDTDFERRMEEAIADMDRELGDLYQLITD